jgi:putative transposase
MPFERFTRERLESCLALHPVSPEGRQFLESALAAPSRNVQGTTRNVASDLPCPKMWGNAQAESWSAENPFTLEHIFNTESVGYTNQVPTVELLYKGRNNRTVRSTYTGDCLVIDSRCGIVLEEWKPASDRGQLEEKYPGKYTRLESGEYTSKPICEVVNPWGIQFVVRFSDELSTIAQRNRRFLYPYLQPSASQHYASQLPYLLSLLQGTPYRSYADLIESGADRDSLNWAIAFGHLHIDFDAALISTEPSQVLVFCHREALSAWQLAVRPDGSRPARDTGSVQQKLRPGDVFVFDGRRLTVTMDGATAIYAMDERREYVAIDLHLLASAITAGKVILPTASVAEGPRSRFWSASPAALARAIKRVETLERLDRGESVPLEDQHSASTYRRWRRAIREGEAQGLSPVEALLDFSDERGFHGPHIDQQFSVDLNSWIEAALKGEKNKSAHAIYFDIEAKAEATGRKMIAKSCFYERVSKIRSIATIRDSQGNKVAYQLEPSYWMLELTTPVHCERALELVHFDSTLLDIELRSSLSGDVLGRPWLSIAVCAYTRRVVGMYLSFQPPSYVSSMMLLADIVRRFGRVPDAIVHDWGSEFKAKDWKNALTSLFIARHVRPKSAPRFGAILERIFGIVTRELIDNIAGNTKLRKNVRQITPQSDPTTHSGLWLLNIYLGLEEYFFGIYDSRKHPATLRLPRAHYDASLVAHGPRLHRIRRYEDILSVLMPTAKGRPRVIDPARGIVVNYRYYGHPLLANLSMAGESAVVKPIPFDPGSVLAFVKGNWVICRSGLHDDLQRAPEVVRRCLFEEWRIEQRLAQASHDDARRKVRELIDRLNQKALENKEYWRDRELHDLLSVASFGSETTNTQESPALANLDAMMKRALEAAIKSGNTGKLLVAA